MQTPFVATEYFLRIIPTHKAMDLISSAVLNVLAGDPIELILIGNIFSYFSYAF